MELKSENQRSLDRWRDSVLIQLHNRCSHGGTYRSLLRDALKRNTKETDKRSISIDDAIKSFQELNVPVGEHLPNAIGKGGLKRIKIRCLVDFIIQGNPKKFVQSINNSHAPLTTNGADPNSRASLTTNGADPKNCLKLETSSTDDVNGFVRESVNLTPMSSGAQSSWTPFVKKVIRLNRDCKKEILSSQLKWQSLVRKAGKRKKNEIHIKMDYEMKLITLERFIALSAIPRSSDPVAHVKLSDIQSHREQYFIVFVSHRWWPEGEGSNQPDKESTKFKILVKGLKNLQHTIGEHMKILVWIDFFSIDQDDWDEKSRGILSLPAYVAHSDCLLTPFTDKIHSKSDKDEQAPHQQFSSPSIYVDNQKNTSLTNIYKAFTDAPEVYFGRAWCCLETYLGFMIPLSAVNGRFECQNQERERRPHFLALQGQDCKLYPLPEFDDTALRQLKPLQGALSDEKDRPLIEQILQRYPLPGAIIGYEGEVNAEELPHGKGKQTFDNGDRYDGEWRNGLFHGHGIYLSKNGDRYEGQWAAGKKHGFGNYEKVGWHRYEGNFEEGKEHGQGTQYFPDGQRREGFWVQGKKHGQATYTNEDGTREEENWENDVNMKNCTLM